jgi:hypothetical protein
MITQFGKGRVVLDRQRNMYGIVSDARGRFVRVDMLNTEGFMSNQVGYSKRIAHEHLTVFPDMTKDEKDAYTTLRLSREELTGRKGALAYVGDATPPKLRRSPQPVPKQLQLF